MDTTAQLIRPTPQSVRPAQDLVRLEGLVRSFGPVHAVRGLDLTVERGQTVALLGPNGAGKSTTVDMLLGLTRPDEGRVSIFGRTPADAVAEGLLGAMAQSGGLVRDLTVRELLSLLAALYPAPLAVGDVLDRAGLGPLAGRRTQQLSGGEAQRVRFAAALVSDPDLLVLDEPTVAMDVEGRRRFWASMQDLASGGRTVLFATHYLEEADAFADRIVLMAQGRVVADGTGPQIKARVGGRQVRVSVPGVTTADLEGLSGVTAVDLRGEEVRITSTDSDASVRELLARFPRAHDLEVTGVGLEDAFLALTSSEEPRSQHQHEGAAR